MEPDLAIIGEIGKYEMTEETVREQLLANRHNRCTATYYLMLKSTLKERNQTLLDYYRIKQVEDSER